MASADSNPQTKREGLPEDEDSGVSMVEVLEEEEQLEADAKAVLGDSDDKNCTYPLVSWHSLGLGLALFFCEASLYPDSHSVSDRSTLNLISLSLCCNIWKTQPLAHRFALRLFMNVSLDSVNHEKYSLLARARSI